MLSAIKATNPFHKYTHVTSSEKYEPPLGSDTAYPIATHFSVEGLQLHTVAEGTSTAIQMGEYGTLFAIEKRQTQQNTISELTNMYDGNPISVKIVSRNTSAENYTISLLAASTESWIGDFCSGKNISGGFVNRHLIIKGKPDRIIPNPTPPPMEELQDIIERYSNLIPASLIPVIEEKRIKWKAQKTKIIWTSEAEAIWNFYYVKRVKEMRSLKDTRLAELSARELTHATKRMGLSAFLDRRVSVTIRDLEFGIQFSRWLIQNLITMMKSNGTPKSEAGVRVFNKLKKSGPMSKADLARALGGQQREINKAIGHMLLDATLEDCPDGLLRLKEGASNSQQIEIDKFFGKSNVSEAYETFRLELGRASASKFDCRGNDADQ